MITITAANNNLVEQAQLIAKQWGFYFSDDASQEHFFLQLTPQHLQLIQPDKRSPGPVYIDFSAGQIAHRRLFGGGKNQTIAKAVALNKKTPPIILDATAGMGKDAFVFASLGAEVILMERSPVAAALLTDALHRASTDEAISDIIKRMSFIFADARHLTLAHNHEKNSPEKNSPEKNPTKISNSSPADDPVQYKKPFYLNDSLWMKVAPDVIYLDPMFPHRTKTALVKKEMRALQSLIGDDTDSNELLPACRQLARQRVVVKRPIKAPYLDAQKPSLSMKMKKHRFDIYISVKH